MTRAYPPMSAGERRFFDSFTEPVLGGPQRYWRGIPRALRQRAHGTMSQLPASLRTYPLSSSQFSEAEGRMEAYRPSISDFPSRMSSRDQPLFNRLLVATILRRYGLQLHRRLRTILDPHRLSGRLMRFTQIRIHL